MIRSTSLAVRRQQRLRRLRHAARSAAVWLADAILADPELSPATIAQQLATMRLLSALAAETTGRDRLRLIGPADQA